MNMMKSGPLNTLPDVANSHIPKTSYALNVPLYHYDYTQSIWHVGQMIFQLAIRYFQPAAVATIQVSRMEDWEII